MSRLSRLSRFQYRRLSDEQKRAFDSLRWLNPDAAGRGRAKTMLGWRRSREETVAYALELLAEGLMVSAVADRLKVSDDYLKRVLDPENRSRNRADRAEDFGLTGSGKVIAYPNDAEAPAATFDGEP